MINRLVYNRNLLINIICLFVLSVVAIAIQIKIDKKFGEYRVIENLLYVQKPEVLKKLIPAFHSFIADIYWLRSIQFVMSNNLKERVNDTYLLFDIITTLDPHFKGPFLFGSTFLAMSGIGANAPEQAIRLLNKAINYFPNHHTFYIYKSMIYYTDMQEFEKAADTMYEASKLIYANENLKFIAAVMYGKANQLAKAKTIIHELSDKTKDSSLRKKSEDLLMFIQATVDMEKLQLLLDIYYKKKGKKPISWQSLINMDLIKETPLDPTGIAYDIDQTQNKVIISQRSSLYQFKNRFKP